MPVTPGFVSVSVDVPLTIAHASTVLMPSAGYAQTPGGVRSKFAPVAGVVMVAYAAATGVVLLRPAPNELSTAKVSFDAAFAIAEYWNEPSVQPFTKVAVVPPTPVHAVDVTARIWIGHDFPLFMAL